MAELKLDEELNDLIDDIIADSKLSEEEFELLKDEFAERDLDIKDYLNELDAVFQQRLADGGKNIVKFNIYWKAYRIKFEKNIDMSNITEDNLSVVFDKDFEDLLNATIIDGKIDKNEMAALAAECQKNNLSLDDLEVLLEERLELIDSSKLDRFRISWKARLDEYQRENNNAAQSQPEPIKSTLSSHIDEPTAVAPTAVTTPAVPQEQYSQEQSSDDDFRKRKGSSNSIKKEKPKKKGGCLKFAIIAGCVLVGLFLLINILPNISQQIENDTQVAGPNRVAANSKIDETRVLIAALDKINNNEDDAIEKIEAVIADNNIPQDIRNIIRSFYDLLTTIVDYDTNEEKYNIYMSHLTSAEDFITYGEKLMRYLRSKGIGDVRAMNYAKIIPYCCLYYINCEYVNSVKQSTSAFSKYLATYVRGQVSIDYKDANVICYYFCSMIYGTEQGFWSGTFQGNKNKDKLIEIYKDLRWYRENHEKDIGDNGGLREHVMYLNTVQNYLVDRINGNRWQQGRKLEWFKAETY